MKAVVLGSVGYHPNERRHTSCILFPAHGLVLDAGTGFFRIRKHIQTTSLEICLSHAHLDHVVGLTYLLNILRKSDVEHIVIRGEAEKLLAVEKHLFSDLIFPVPIAADWIALEEGPLEILGGGKLTHFPLDDHPGGTVGYRIDQGGASFAYVADTCVREQPSYLEAIRGVDVLVHECNFRDGSEELAAKSGHSCTSQVAQLAARAEVGRLIMTHFDTLEEGDDPVGLESARALFPSTDLAEDGMEIEIPSAV